MMRLLSLILPMIFLILAGCSETRHIFPTKEVPKEELAQQLYHKVTLRKDSAAEVLDLFSDDPDLRISQSTKVLAFQGERSKERTFWINTFIFDEDDLLVLRKHLLIVSEGSEGKLWGDTRGVLGDVRTSFIFRTQIILEEKIMKEPYADKNAQRIAIIKEVSQLSRDDLGEVTEDNKTIRIAQAMINEAFKTLLLKLDESPVLASTLKRPEGMRYSHMTLDEARAQMFMRDNVVTLNIFMGKAAK
jgi:hypothetical protein